jgi:hypothetical protein
MYDVYSKTLPTKSFCMTSAMEILAQPMFATKSMLDA